MMNERTVRLVRWISARRLAALALVASASAVHTQPLRPVSVDDLMRVRTIMDAKIAPGGETVAYVVSTPSIEKNVQETALFVVPAAGGAPKRIAEDRQIFTPSLPAPRLRWTPDGRSVAFLGLAGVAATGLLLILLVMPETRRSE